MSVYAKCIRNRKSNNNKICVKLIPLSPYVLAYSIVFCFVYFMRTRARARARAHNMIIIEADVSHLLTCPVSVSNLYSLIAGLFEPTVVFIGVIDGAIIIHETGLPAITHLCRHSTYTHTINRITNEWRRWHDKNK